MSLPHDAQVSAIFRPASAVLYVPKNGIHAFRNDSGEPAAMLILFAPGPPREEYFNALAENARVRRTMTDEERTAFLARHDQYMVDSPS